MIYIRGNRADYDGWGAPGWSWDDLFPYFLKAEDNERGASRWHGVGGPLPVSDQRSGNAITPAFVEAGVEAGLSRNDDFNAAEQDGAGMYQVTQRGGMRASAAVAYLHPAMERPNLTVMPHMQVTRILFDGTRASGVEATQLGQTQELRAEREVILSAGTYNSPQLLMLSGVGPAEHLALREVEPLLDQPAVGANLSDHAASFAVWTTPEPESLLAALEPAALEEFAATQTGPFASNLAESGAFARVEAGAEAPDTQFHVAPVHIVEEGMGDPQAHGVWVSPCLLTPASRGSVQLASNDPSAKPIVRHSFFSAEEDMPRMIAAVRLMQEICARPAMAPYCADPFTGPGRRQRGRPPRPRRRHHLPDLPPGGDLRDRLGRRRRPPRPGPRGNPRRRRLGDAGGAPRQHQRPGDRDRRARRRPDQGGEPARRRGRRAVASRGSLVTEAVPAPAKGYAGEPSARSMNGPSRSATAAAVRLGRLAGRRDVADRQPDQRLGEQADVGFGRLRPALLDHRREARRRPVDDRHPLGGDEGQHAAGAVVAEQDADQRVLAGGAEEELQRGADRGARVVEVLPDRGLDLVEEVARRRRSRRRARTRCGCRTPCRGSGG